MSFFKKNQASDIQKKQWKIKKECLQLIFECAKSTHPNEFGGLLRVDSTTKDTIIEIVLLPGTISGESHAIFRMNMKPIDFSIVGTVHSHPSPIPLPSNADLQLFRKQGNIHIISAHPYTLHSFKAYTGSGIETQIDIV